MSEEQEQSQKTEDPTHKRLEDALKKGQVVTSKEVNNFFILLALTFLIMLLAPGVMSDVKGHLTEYIASADDIDLDAASFRQNMSDLLLAMLIDLMLVIVMVIAAVFAANVVQNRFIFSLEPIKPKLEKISPLKGLKRLFSRRSLVEFLKGILKIVVISVVVVMAIYPDKEALNLLPNQDVYETLRFIMTICGRVMIGVCIIMFVIAILDFAYQKFEHLQQLRMTKQEVKDEYKQQEGDPMVKQRLRQIRRERLAKQMMAAVPSADVVITNPTHFAVALKYDSMTMTAPVLVAKGKDAVALKIKEIAQEHKIITLRNPPLTRLLFDNVKVDEIIPLEYYKAVAEIIGYVYKLKGRTINRRK